MALNEIRPSPKERKRKKRVGRGPSSGRGKTCGRGTKGQGARAGKGVRPGFEGGQMPLIRRVPKRGFTPINKEKYAVVNVGTLERFSSGTHITPEVLRKEGIIKGPKGLKVKLLGEGALSKKFKISLHAFSKSAVKKVKDADGEIEVI